MTAATPPAPMPPAEVEGVALDAGRPFALRAVGLLAGSGLRWRRQRSADVLQDVQREERPDVGNTNLETVMREGEKTPADYANNPPSTEDAAQCLFLLLAAAGGKVLTENQVDIGLVLLAQLLVKAGGDLVVFNSARDQLHN